MREKNYRKSLGKKGEEFTARYLESRGMKILKKNFRTREGEIDIIAADESSIVFIEVKTRSVESSGSPEESINQKKQDHLKRIAEIYLAQNNMMEREVRFDVLALSWNARESRWQARWIKRAF